MNSNFKVTGRRKGFQKPENTNGVQGVAKRSSLLEAAYCLYDTSKATCSLS